VLFDWFVGYFTLSRMQSTLTVRTNALLLGLYVAVLTACLLSTGFSHLAFLVPFVACGAAAGWLQSQALNSQPQRFASAIGELEIRRLLWSTPQGKASLLLVWLNGAGCLALFFYEPAEASLATVFAAYASFALAREVSTFRSVRELARTNRKQSA
jgi:hypothetical protein